MAAAPGKNSCKGKGGCATAEKHGCKGQNACKGQGGCKSGDGGCAGKNSCKGKGGCAVPPKPKGHSTVPVGAARLIAAPADRTSRIPWRPSRNP